MKVGRHWPAKLQHAARDMKQCFGWPAAKVRKELKSEYGADVPRHTVYLWIRSIPDESNTKRAELDRIMKKAHPSLKRYTVKARLARGWTVREAALIPKQVQSLPDSI